LDSAVGRSRARDGRVVSLPRAAALMAREVMPSVGARAPGAEQVDCGPLEGEGDSVLVEFDAALPPPGQADAVVRALELAELTRSADDALAKGALEVARMGYLAALERAPRHPEISRLIAELDLHADDRAEAALSVLLEATGPAEAGAVGAALLARVGDRDGACDALRAATRDEEFAPLASLLLAEVASYEVDAPARLRALDDAVARCPGLAGVRWKRFEARLGTGDVRGALADAEHLEAGVSGSAARHAVCRRAASELLELGFQRDAGRLFERALRYLPNDATATAGLGRALLESGKASRAVALLERAIAIGEEKGEPQFDALVDLAKILAKMADLPQAIARLRQVAAPSERLVEARALEARYREQLGDVAGSSLAYARLREALELGAPARTAEAIDWLKDAARFEWDVRKDAASSERHLAIALRLAPRDKAVGDAYRNIAAILAASVRRRDRTD
jgi:tetratricopeptide (TPR) repeat protein